MRSEVTECDFAIYWVLQGHVLVTIHKWNTRFERSRSSLFLRSPENLKEKFRHWIRKVWKFTFYDWRMQCSGTEIHHQLHFLKTIGTQHTNWWSTENIRSKIRATRIQHRQGSSGHLISQNNMKYIHGLWGSVHLLVWDTHAYHRESNMNDVNNPISSNINSLMICIRRKVRTLTKSKN